MKSLCKQNCCFLMNNNKCDVLKNKDTNAAKECKYYECRDDYEDEEVYELCNDCHSEFPLSCLNECSACGATVCDDCLINGLCRSCEEEEYYDDEDEEEY